MTVRIIAADVFEGLALLPDESVHCVVTSPPYWGLRDYGTATWVGGSSICEHEIVGALRTPWANEVPGPNGRVKNPEASSRRPKATGGHCARCGAERIDHQIGLEPTPEAFVAKMVEVFREVRRVLRDDGTLWLNLGDSYAGSWGAQGRQGGSGQMAGRSIIAARQIAVGQKHASRTGSPDRTPGLKPKDLIGMPWMVAFALRADGWWLRSEIIWHKPNPMPESVTDRCTKAHEHVFLLSKSERYFYDAAAIREGATYSGPNSPSSQASPYGQGYTRRAEELNRIGSKGNANGFRGGSYVGGQPGKRTETGNGPNETLSRNKRSVWTIATQPFPEAHFATFPEELAETCIKAGCPAGGTVLDPFGGAGTTGLVADRLGRDAILIELNPEYAAMAERRIKGDCPMFADVER